MFNFIRALCICKVFHWICQVIFGSLCIAVPVCQTKNWPFTFSISKAMLSLYRNTLTHFVIHRALLTLSWTWKCCIDSFGGSCRHCLQEWRLKWRRMQHRLMFVLLLPISATCLSGKHLKLCNHMFSHVWCFINWVLKRRSYSNRKKEANQRSRCPVVK